MKTADPSETRRNAFDWVQDTGTLERVRGKVLERVTRKKRTRKRVAKGSAAALLILALLTWLVPYYRDTGHLATLPAQRSEHTLSDGSIAELNARTELATDFRYGRRIVHLKSGEAFFSVQSDPDHPFLVQTPSGTVRVTGTQFNVRLDESGHAEVTLLEGHVQFEQEQKDTVKISPSEQFASASNSVRTLDPAALERSLAWRSNQFILDGLTVREAVTRMAAQNGIPAKVDDSVASLRTGGSCPLDDFPSFLRALEDTLPLKAHRMADGSYRVISR